MKQTIKLLAIVFLITICSCNQQEDQGVRNRISIGAEREEVACTEEVGSTNEPIELKEENIAAERKIIKEGRIGFKTTNSADTRKLIAVTVSELQGYISKDDVSNYDNITYDLTIRVPSNNFDLLLDKISQNADEFDYKTIKAIDVTEEFVDIEARIKTKKELENRYKELLKQANKVDEILEIEREIGSLREEIESVEGRLRYLNDKVTYSTLTVTFYEKANSSFGFGSKIKDALQNGWKALLWFFVVLTNLWPFIIIIAVGIFIIIRYKRKKKSKTDENISRYE